MGYHLEIEGVEEVISMFSQLEKVSQSTVTKAAKAGMNIVKKDARKNAPVGKKNGGKLKRSIKVKSEKRKNGKKVYDIQFIGDGLAKVSKDGKRSFYPVSQEYGWITKKGNKIIPKKAKFFRNAVDKNRDQVKQTMINTMADDLKKVK